MKLFEYKPVEYVDVHNEIPVEWMAGQLKEKQGAYDNQLDAINKASESNLKLNTGAFGTKLYDELQKDLQGRLTSMTDNLMTRGDVAGASGQFSKYLRDFSLDPRVKTLNKDYDLWKLHQEKLLANPGAIDMSQYGPQIGENGTTPEQAFRNYNIVLPENSIEELEQTVNKLKPNVSDDGKTFSFYDPVRRQVVKSTDKAQIEQLSQQRIKQLRDDYYVNWMNNPKSMYHKIKLSDNNLDLFNTPEGRKKYNELTEYLLNYAYTERRDLEDQDPYSTNSTKPPRGGGDGSSDSEQAAFIPTMGVAYGRGNALGLIEDQPGSYINDPDSMARNIETIDKKQAIALNIMYMTKNDPSKKAEYDKADADWKALEEKKKVDKSWQQYVEKELYNSVPAGEYAKAREIEKNWINEHSLDIADFGALSMITGKTKEQLMKEILYDGVTTYSGVDYEDIPEFLQKAKEWRDKNLPANMKELLSRYEKYNAYTTTGVSYVINGAKNKAAALTLFNGLVSSQLPPKSMITDKEVPIDELPQTLEAYKKEDGSYDLDRISFEILADDMDGLVFGVHLLDKENKAHGYEFKLESTPNIREFLGTMLPHEDKILTAFTQATQSLKGSHRQASGAFTLTKFNGEESDIEFIRKPVGNGQFNYKAKISGKEYNSINDLIVEESMPTDFLNIRYQEAYIKLQTAIKKRDTAAYYSALDTIGELDAVEANMGKPTSQGKQGQFRQTPKTPLQ
jgi:hypothetical protein